MNIYRHDSKPTLLVAEDAPHMRAAVADLLDDDFNVVASVGNGRVAVNAAVQLMPDIVVLDVSVPTLDGLEVALRLKAQRCAAKVIFLTASNDPVHVEACLAAGGDACVWEPRAGTDLVYAIKEVLAGRLFFDVTPDYDGILN